MKHFSTPSCTLWTKPRADPVWRSVDPKFALAPGLGRSFYAATRKDDGQLHLDTLAQAEVPLGSLHRTILWEAQKGGCTVLFIL